MFRTKRTSTKAHDANSTAGLADTTNSQIRPDLVESDLKLFESKIEQTDATL